MPYPEEAEGFQVDGPETFTEFHKRFVSLLSPVLGFATIKG
jgi:alcohol dehydrogenase (NADP+)